MSREDAPVEQGRSFENVFDKEDEPFTGGERAGRRESTLQWRCLPGKGFIVGGW